MFSINVSTITCISGIDMHAGFLGPGSSFQPDKLIDGMWLSCSWGARWTTGPLQAVRSF